MKTFFFPFHSCIFSYKMPSSNGMRLCSQCKAGRKMVNRDTAGLETSCEKCDPGFYNDIPGNETCKYCPIGYYQNEKGLSYCIGCIPGTYENKTGSHVCKKCATGQYQNLPGNTTCIECPIGCAVLWLCCVIPIYSSLLLFLHLHHQQVQRRQHYRLSFHRI